MTADARARPRLQAMVWDVDGTLAETERDGHRVAFNRAFAALALPWEWDEQHYGRLLLISGGRERVLHDLKSRGAVPADAEARETLARTLHRLKNGFYAELVRRRAIALRPGVRALLQDCRDSGMPMAIATTTSRSNVTVLLEATLGETWRDWFRCLVCGEDVARKKPDPEVYRAVCAQLCVAPDRAVAIEDAPDGAAAAQAAGLPVIVTRSHYFGEQEPAGGVKAIGPGLHEAANWRPCVPGVRAGRRVTLQDIEAWWQA